MARQCFICSSGHRMPELRLLLFDIRFNPCHFRKGGQSEPICTCSIHNCLFDNTDCFKKKYYSSAVNALFCLYSERYLLSRAWYSVAFIFCIFINTIHWKAETDRRSDILNYLYFRYVLGCRHVFSEYAESNNDVYIKVLAIFVFLRCI